MRTTSTEILKEIMSSAAHGHIIGIKMKNRSRMFITAVEGMLSQTSIILRSSSVHSHAFEQTSIDLTQIESVIRLNSSFEDGLADQVNAIKRALSM